MCRTRAALVEGRSRGEVALPDTPIKGEIRFSLESGNADEAQRALLQLAELAKKLDLTIEDMGLDPDTTITLPELRRLVS
jgi:hypothetical protein